MPSYLVSGKVSVAHDTPDNLVERDFSKQFEASDDKEALRLAPNQITNLSSRRFTLKVYRQVGEVTV